MIIQPVTSENSGQEGNWVAFLCILILLIGALLLPYNREATHQQQLESHQVPIKALTKPSLSMIADLRLADEEVRYLYQTDQAWPSVTQLELDWVAPFVKDKSWAYQGEHQWLQVAPGIYQSKPAKGGARYLLNSLHNDIDIWIDFEQQKPSIKAPLIFAQSSKAQSVPVMVIDSELLIKAGWTQVVFEADKKDTHTSH